MKRVTLSLSDSLAAQLEAVAEGDETTQAEVFRKALQLYLRAKEASSEGMLLGTVSKAKKSDLETEFVNL